MIPRGEPASPDVRANTRSWVARCIPVLNRLAPLMTQSPPSGAAVVSSQVASLPCPGSVSPKPISTWRLMIGSISSRWADVPTASSTRTMGKLPTIADSVWRSECRPSGLLARCSRTQAMARLVPPAPPCSRASE